jgi:hypothetical protein
LTTSSSAADSVLIVANGVTIQDYGQYNLTLTVTQGSISSSKTCFLDI